MLKKGANQQLFVAFRCHVSLIFYHEHTASFSFFLSLDIYKESKQVILQNGPQLGFILQFPLDWIQSKHF